MQSCIYPIIGNEKQLPFYLSGIGRSDPEYHVDRPAGLLSHQLLLTLEGEGVLQIDGSTQPLRARSVLYLAPGVPHVYYPLTGGWKTFWLVFRGDLLSELMPRLGFTPYQYKEGCDITALRSRLDLIFAVASASPTDTVQCSRLIYDSVLETRAIFSAKGASQETNALAARAVRLLEAHFSEDITLDWLASSLQISRQHVCRIFRRWMGMRPMEYVARRRVSAARQLLCASDRSIAEIAAAVGYASTTYFGMVFRKYEGVSPSEYRSSKNYLI